jgi:hypothetical protein
MRVFLPVLASIVLIGCASNPPPKPDAVPKDLVPKGFTAADCHVVKPAEAITQQGPDGRPVSTGMRAPEVACEKPGANSIATKSTPVCHTQRGKPLPLADCCMTESGDPIPACMPKIQPPGE